MVDVVLGLDISRTVVGVGILSPSGRAASLTARFTPHDFASLVVVLQRIRAALEHRRIVPVTVAVEEQFSEADVFDPSRVHVPGLLDRQLWNRKACIAVRTLWPKARHVTVHPKDTLRLAFGDEAHRELGRLRLKPVLYELVRQSHPELGLPEVEHRLRPDGSIEMDDDVRYDESDSVSLARAAGALLGDPSGSLVSRS